MKMICFGSGSSGNCYYLESNGDAILIDLGIGVRAFRRHLSNYGIAIPTIKAILVTHDHTDHIKALGPFVRDFSIPVYATELSHEGVQRNRMMTKKVPPHLRRTTIHNEPFEVGNFRILPFAVPHDAWGGNSGYFIEKIVAPTSSDDLFEAKKRSVEGSNFCIITDCGNFQPHLAPFVARAKNLVIEANYDRELLATGPYPLYLQQRIQGGNGHLANDEAASALVAHLTPTTERIWLCHLSAENNHPAKALSTIVEAVHTLPFGKNIAIEALRRTLPSGPYEL